MIDHIEVISWDIQILQELLSTEMYTSLLLSTDPIIFLNEYNSCLFIEYKHTTGYLLIQRDPADLIYNSDLLDLIPCELDSTSTQFSDTNILTYEIDLYPDGKKIGFNLLYDKYFTIPYVTDTIQIFPVFQLPK